MEIKGLRARLRKSEEDYSSFKKNAKEQDEGLILQASRSHSEVKQYQEENIQLKHENTRLA